MVTDQWERDTNNLNVISYVQSKNVLKKCAKFASHSSSNWLRIIYRKCIISQITKSTLIGRIYSHVSTATIEICVCIFDRTKYRNNLLCLKWKLDGMKEIFSGKLSGARTITYRKSWSEYFREASIKSPWSRWRCKSLSTEKAFSESLIVPYTWCDYNIQELYMNIPM